MDVQLCTTCGKKYAGIKALILWSYQILLEHFSCYIFTRKMGQCDRQAQCACYLCIDAKCDIGPLKWKVSCKLRPTLYNLIN